MVSIMTYVVDCRRFKINFPIMAYVVGRRRFKINFTIMAYVVDCRRFKINFSMMRVTRNELQNAKSQFLSNIGVTYAVGFRTLTIGYSLKGVTYAVGFKTLTIGNHSMV